ncbi:hypothetical protein BDP27DRAFT_1227639 [Rhodocollybia butyracea]|uniref:F-box domain-containing protein n=1 Tax=Rhodocollybia butyracea TaxID=206335 RepID=A0A9P5PN50_9AGAR|nr:hypothetical protein BDP27DRAFT_1227639 [Rhodocollybia butyracea]
MEKKFRTEFGPFGIDSKTVEEVEEMVALADKDIEDHDFELARLHRQILAVEAENHRLEKQKAKICALLSPIRMLPNELLLRSLEFVCQQDPNEITPSFDTTCLPTMAISSVCFRWRELALCSPALWANLAVWVSDTDVQTFFTETVARYLERSVDCPLILALSIQGRCRTGIPSLIPLMVVQHAHRWETFKYFQLGDDSLKDHILSQLHFPLLEELDIMRDFHLFEHCPRLHVLTTKRSIPELSHNQLDHLNFVGGSLIDLAEALRTWPSLKSFEMHSVYCSNPNLKKRNSGHMV